MADHREFYRLDPRPIGVGGQAQVFRATDRLTEQVVALKRVRGLSSISSDRMRREISVQVQLQHEHVMPILRYDADKHEWFSMPLAESSLESQPRPMPIDVLLEVLEHCALGLREAHSRGYVHRDIKPSNVLRLDYQGSRRWVVADWGIVRRPVGETTARNTHDGTLLGTEGFAPPEAYASAHDATSAWDSYSLGRLAAWAVTGEHPRPLVELSAPEPWRRFVRVMTMSEIDRRPADMSKVLRLVAAVRSSIATPAGLTESEVELAKRGDVLATERVLHDALSRLNDAPFFIDQVAPISGESFAVFVKENPSLARSLLEQMGRHLEQMPWGYRNFDYYNVPLRWIQRLAEIANQLEYLDLCEDACDVLFRLEPPLDRWTQAQVSRSWIASLRGPSAARVARLLRDHPKAAKYYGELPHASDESIRASLRQTSPS